jgi:ribulose-5-phosphate 4-epimerase/fuculose-1-phosphate aldolase
MSMLVSERPAAAAADAAVEAQARRDLAACYRLVAHFGWDDLVATHISARLPGKDVFLINPFGVLFEEITASSLVKINGEGAILSPTPHQVNQAGFVIHSAVHQAREDAGCVIHLHTLDGVAVSMLEEGLLPLNQTAMIVARRMAFHEYEGVATDLEERQRLQADLGDKNYMLLRNHGTLVVGRTIAEAFVRCYFLERSCTTQIRAMSAGRPLHHASPAAIAKVEAQTDPTGPDTLSRELVWPAMLRKLERMDSSYAD